MGNTWARVAGYLFYFGVAAGEPVVAVMGGIEVHRRMPISLTFDHRACTGGEAARFLAALLDDLAQPT